MACAEVTTMYANERHHIGIIPSGERKHWATTVPIEVRIVCLIRAYRHQLTSEEPISLSVINAGIGNNSVGPAGDASNFVNNTALQQTVALDVLYNEIRPLLVNDRVAVHTSRAARGTGSCDQPTL